MKRGKYFKILQWNAARKLCARSNFNNSKINKINTSLFYLSNQKSGTRRMYSSAELPSEALVARYEKHGIPDDVIKVQNEKLPKVGDNDVLLEMLMAPINPADINMVEGVYPIKPKLPAVGGNEGVAQVLAVGSKVTGITVDDWVIPAKPGFGTWRTYAVCPAETVLKVPQDIKPEYAACMSVNPPTAYRLLEDFVDLKEGDVVIQNGGTSAVAQAVSQLAALRGIITISIIRSRVDHNDTAKRLKQYGATIVVDEQDFVKPSFTELISDLPKPKLALNCVGGASATELARRLGDNGVLVTYGGMSKKPVQVPTALLIFKNITLKGFWLSKWTEEHSVKDRMIMIKKLWDLVRDKKIENVD